ncbi:MAG: TrkA family potassium uptake protein [Caldilineaceae bacterium]|nr:TrkA family potassium uptake protein [Caldilineaceae bacterium]MXZ22511.1 TrkA family potassium uptake protein [Caldilineaceae bacterium SB0665_bin_25]
MTASIQINQSVVDEEPGRQSPAMEPAASFRGRFLQIHRILGRLMRALSPLAVQTTSPAPEVREDRAAQETAQYSPFRRRGRDSEFVVIGLGRFGTAVATTLVENGRTVLAIDSDHDRVQALSGELPHVVQLDATNIDALRQAGVETFDTGLVCIGTDFENNLLATVLLRQLGVQRVIAKALTITQREILLKVGADEVILPEHEAGRRLGRKMAVDHLVDYLEVSNDVGVVELLAPPSTWEHSLSELSLRQRYGLTVIAVRRGDDLIVSPSAGFRLKEEDIVVVLGRMEDAERMRQ